ncbi:TPA: hypothetical protein ACNH31_004500 [Citrobacter freundii]
MKLTCWSWEKTAIVIPIIISLCTAYLSYVIADNQSKISKLEYTPIFIFQKSLEYDEVLKIYHTERLTISNEGYPIQNFDKVIHTFLLVEQYTERERKEILIPINYFWVSYTANGGKGKLSDLFGKNNNSHYFDLTREIIEYNEKNREKTIITSLINTAKLSYVEADGSIKESYYKDEKLTTKDDVMVLEGKSINMSPKDIGSFKIDDLLELLN